MSWLWRLVAVPFGLVFAVTASLLFLVMASIVDPIMRILAAMALWVGFWPVIEPTLSIEDAEALADAGRLIATVIFAPPALVCIAGEVVGTRRLLWYAGATGILTGALPWLARGGARVATPDEIHVAAVLFLAGAVAGFVYWLIAGRSAGPEPEPVSGSMSLGS